MIESMRVNEVFRTVIWTVDLKPEAYQPLNESLRAAIREQTRRRDKVPAGSNWQSHTDLHRLPAFQPLVEHIRKSAKGAFEFLEIRFDEFEISGCWANIAPRGTKHSTHNHPNNYLSGVYYVQVPKGGDAIEFLDPRPQASIIAPDVIRPNPYNGNTVTVEAKEGRLVMFHAYLMHAVPVNQGRQDRISIAYNIMFPRFGETMGPPKFKGNAHPS